MNQAEKMEQYIETMLKLIDVKAGERVWISAPAVAKDMLLEIQKKTLLRGAFADLQIYFEEAAFNYLCYSPLENLKIFSPAEKARIDSCDKHMKIWCKDDYVIDYDKIPPENLKTRNISSRNNTERLNEIPGVGAYYPTRHLAKNAGMEWEKYLEFFYDAVTVDLFALYDEFRWLEEIVSVGKEIHITGEGTDLYMDITGRKCSADDSYFWNVPDGELFTSPVETGTRGYISFENPLVYADSVTIKDLFLEFDGGKVVNFRASQGGKFFEEILNTDEGSRILGEIGIGINPKVDRITNNDLFDEKIIGTIHIALGNGFVESGSKNISAIHWDLVKDLRKNGKIFIDGKPVSDSGMWIKP
jgi:aminopeptidase